MVAATYAVTSFLGGEVSQFYQGRFDRPDYKTFLAVCLNALPREEGPWTRRPGTMFAGAARSGATAARVIRFDFEAIAPYTLEFTDSAIRFRHGLTWATTNDTAAISAISTANPAVMTLAAPATWVTGSVAIIGNLGTGMPLLQNRQFTLTKIDTTHFSIADPFTGAPIDGSTLGAFPPGATASRIQEVFTSYPSGLWSQVRAIQAETNAVLLQATVPPQLLTVSTLPGPGTDAQFSLAALTLLDGPYLDPFTNGAQVTPSALSGSITLTLSFQLYAATQAYETGALVTSSSVNYQSLIDNNVNNTPASSPTAWAPVSAGVAINNGKGFLGTDTGRLVRLYSEPPQWAVGTTYAAGNRVSYNPTGTPGGSTYWTSLVGSNVGHIPGVDITNWEPAVNAALWSWGKMTGLANQISGTLAGSTNIGDLTSAGGLAAAFDGNTNKVSGSCASATGTGIQPTGYVGKNYTGAAAQVIDHGVLWPSTDIGLCLVGGAGAVSTVVINLRAKNTLPTSRSDGALLGTTTLTFNPTTPVGVPSNSAAAWNYVWLEIIVTLNRSETASLYVAQAQFFNPPGTGTGTAVTIELLGPPLLYTTPIFTWRMGAYSATTGYPSCGTYHEGRLWFGGAIGNRFDSSVSNGLVGTTLNMAPTDQYGVVAASAAISEVINDNGVNPILSMTSDLQGIIMTTLAGGWLIAPGTAGAMSPVNISARPLAIEGAANVEPRRAAHTLCYVQRFGRKLNECFADVYSGKLSAPNLAEKAMHIPKPGIAELAYTSAVTPVIWGRKSDGTWFGVTYKRDVLSVQAEPKFAAWHRHALGSGRSVISMCAGPSTGGNLDALTMVTTDGAIAHVEVMTDAIDEGATNAQAQYLDDAINPSSVQIVPTPVTGFLGFIVENELFVTEMYLDTIVIGGTVFGAAPGTTIINQIAGVPGGSGAYTVSVNQTLPATIMSMFPNTPYPYGYMKINGLWHLNGKTVQCWAGGLDCGASGNPMSTQFKIADFVVTNGSIFVPFGDGVNAGSGFGMFTQSFAAALPLSQILVGFTFTSQGRLVRPMTPQDSGARTGPALGKIRREDKFAMLLEGVAIGAISVAGDFSHLKPLNLKLGDDSTALPVGQQFSDIHRDSLDSTYGYDGRFAWQVTRPYIANVVALQPFLGTQDE